MDCYGIALIILALVLIYHLCWRPAGCGACDAKGGAPEALTSGGGGWRPFSFLEHDAAQFLVGAGRRVELKDVKIYGVCVGKGTVAVCNEPYYSSARDGGLAAINAKVGATRAGALGVARLADSAPALIRALGDFYQDKSGKEPIKITGQYRARD